MKGEKQHEIIEKKVYDLFLQRVGKVNTTESYSNSKEFIIMFPNDYSIIVREQSRKHSSVEIYHGIGNVNHRYFKTKRSNRKVSRAVVESLISRISSEKQISNT